MIGDVIKTISEGLRINPQATKIAIGAYIVMALSIALLQVLGDQGITLWQMLVAFCVLMLVMLALPVLPRLPRVVVGWFIVLAFSLWAGAIIAQTITGNRIPYLASAKCIASFHMAQGCDVTVAEASGKAVAVEVPTEGSADLPDDLPTIAVPAEEAGPPPIPEGNRVYIQFAGYDRETIIALAAALGAEGWGVEGGDRGGQRIGAASGRNEIRFFNAADRLPATNLALATSRGLPGQPQITVVDMTGTRFAKDAPGHFEVWVGQ